MKKFGVWILVPAFLVAAWLAVNVGIGVLLVKTALHPFRRGLTEQEKMAAEDVASRNRAGLADVAIRAQDGSTLRAWDMRPTPWNGDAVILFHGQADNRAGMLGNADLLMHKGYAVLLPDARAHGASDGAAATYGVKETDDIRRWSDWLRHSEWPHCIDGLGESMGAAQLLQSLQAKPGFCAVVAECPFANFREASFDKLGEALHSGPWLGRTLLRPALWAALAYAQWKYGVNLMDVSPEKAVHDSNVPVLLIHGLRDTSLPPLNSETIVAFNHNRNPQVVLWEPAQANHCGASTAEPEEYERRVTGWFGSHRVSATQ